MGTLEVAPGSRCRSTHCPVPHRTVVDTPDPGSWDFRSSDPDNPDSRSPDFRSREAPGHQLEHGQMVQPLGLIPLT